MNKSTVISTLIIIIAVVIGLVYMTSMSEEKTSSTSNCHPSYSGCLRADASDYDCVGGSGNGPYYTGRVMVIGPDVFGLDRDGDGIGCE